ncbi:efflux RND transporter permease subunit [Rhodothermus marinus]|uniref:efflux RND transporter permease subunit n=1 Tax=Rhodothermus marinus TaxID=29549 RepID=UPI0012BA527C|nr:CusA/CzcA family heavy metal efflux RND transporter [Rhodothermus marinus]BBM70778.1 cation transporter [Rhodothermus marinus]BBM73765.1 cation transporter [Rhodothermus marinus]
MIERLITWSAHNRLLILTLTLLISALGLWATLNTPIDAIPDLSDAQVIIRTEYPGQAPQIVEAQITYPLATAMLAVPGARTVRGYSMFGTSFVYVIFEDGTDLYWARSRVLEYLNQVTLPEGAQVSLGPDATGVGWVFQYSLIDTTGRHDLADLRALQDFFLKYELQSIEGVSEVATVGGFLKQYQVVVDPQKLLAYGISIDQVRQAIAHANQEVGARLLELGEREFLVRIPGYLQGIDDLRQTPLKAQNGTVITLDDVARLQVGPELRRGISERDGEGEVVSGIVVMRYGENALRVIERVKARLAELQASLPEGVKVVVDYDRSRLIREAVHTATIKLWQELAVVALIVLVFLLHVRSAFVALVAVPVGVLISLLIMYLLDINANIMSLGGIAVAIGVMVDASVVMVENAHRHLERLRAQHNRPLRHSEHMQAVLEAAREAGPSLFFSLLVVTLSFLPVFALQNIEGRLFRPLALTKTFAMAAASLLAVTLVPALMVVFVRGKIRPAAQNPLTRLLTQMYQPVIRYALRHPWQVIVGSLLLLGLTLLPVQRLLWGRVAIPFPQIGSEFMPPLNEGDLLYMPTTLPGLSPQKAKELLQLSNRIIKSFPEVASVTGKAGRAETATDPASLSMFETIIQLKDPREWRPGVTLDRLIEEMNRALQIPGVTNAWTMPIKNRTDMLATGMRTPLGIKLMGPELATLDRLGTTLESLLRNMPGTRSVYAERATGGSYLNIVVNRAEAARYGLTIGKVLDVAQAAIGGLHVTTTIEGLERYPVLVRYPQDLRDNLPALRQVLVPTPSGAQVPLGQLAHFELTEGPPMIRSENARPTVWVYIDLAPGVDIGTYVQQAQQLLARELSLPPGYALVWSGQFEYMERANRRLQILGPLTLGLVFLILMLHFGNLREPLMLLSTLPFAAIGAVWLMVALAFDMSVAVAVGYIGVVGLAVETGVVMLTFLDEAVRRYRQAGQLSTIEQLRAAIEEGALLRLRPLLMTVSTTLIGLLPIMFGTETGAEVMKRIAAPMVGGLFTAAALTLVVLPALYLLVERYRWQRRT